MGALSGHPGGEFELLLIMTAIPGGNLVSFHARKEVTHVSIYPAAFFYSFSHLDCRAAYVSGSGSLFKPQGFPA
jgi:hypothetical protein